MSEHDPLLFVVARPAGLNVSGVHDAAHAPVSPALRVEYEGAHARWLAKIAAKPGAFDGHRAVLQHYVHRGEHLALQTNYRTYTQGRALKDAWVQANPQGLAEPPAQPDVGASWGLSLLTLVFLPFGHVLCAQRSPKLMVNPGMWTVAQTEVVEPSDISAGDMSALLRRITEEEMPCLAGLGSHRYIGLGVRAASYTWQLVSVLDLRTASTPVLHALGYLAPDDETAAWCAWPLSEEANRNTWRLPPNLSPRGLPGPVDLELALQIAALL